MAAVPVLMAGKHKRWWIIGGILAVVLIVGIIAGGEEGEDGQHEASSQPAVSAPDAPDAQEEDVETQEEDVEIEAPELTGPSEDEQGSEFDDNTRAFIARAQGCLTAMEIVFAAINEDSDDFEVADNTTQARDICEEAREQLLTADDDEFRDEAALTWSGVDRLKSGLNATLAFLDNPRPSKLVEARDKLQEGRAQVQAGVRQINRLRRKRGLKPIR